MKKTLFEHHYLLGSPWCVGRLILYLHLSVSDSIVAEVIMLHWLLWAESHGVSGSSLVLDIDQNPLHQFPRSKSVTRWRLPRFVAKKSVTSPLHST